MNQAGVTGEGAGWFPRLVWAALVAGLLLVAVAAGLSLSSPMPATFMKLEASPPRMK